MDCRRDQNAWSGVAGRPLIFAGARNTRLLAARGKGQKITEARMAVIAFIGSLIIGFLLNVIFGAIGLA